MFGVVLAGLLGSAFWLWEESSHGHPLPRPALVLGALSLLALLGVLAKMFSHPRGIKDWIQGGVVDVEESASGRLTWMDWAIAITRVGRLDPASGFLKLERRLAFGLIPVGTVLRPVRDFYRVAVETEPRYSSRRRRRSSVLDALGGDEGQQLMGYTYSVFLVDRSGDKLCVLDLAAGTGREEEQFITDLRLKLEAAVTRPPGAPGAKADEPPPSEFEAWRKKKDERGPSA